MFKPTSDLIKELTLRGYIHQCTNIEELDKLVKKKKFTAYVGFDCTAESLHVGSLIQLMLIRILQKYGHQVIVLLGEGTSKIDQITIVGKPSSPNIYQSVGRKKAISLSWNTSSILVTNLFDVFLKKRLDCYSKTVVI